MQSNKQISHGKAVRQGYMSYGSLAPDPGPIVPQGLDFSRPFHQLELQPSDNCPKNFIIFDQNDNRNRIMYHPAYRQQFTYHCPNIDIRAAYLQGHTKDTFTENNECSSSLKEDTRDIDALMSFEDEEVEEDDVISTARTLGNYNCESPDSCSDSHSNFLGSPRRDTNSHSKSRKKRVSSAEKSFSGCSSSNADNEKQRQKMKKMVKALRGIVPGADQMTTAALIDEAVVYLKSLKVEVKELGLGNFTN